VSEQQIAFKNLVERNRRMERDGGSPDPNSVIRLPFVVVNTSKSTVIDCSISDDKYVLLVYTNHFKHSIVPMSGCVGLINEVSQHQAWLVLRWVTVFWQVRHLGVYSANYVNSVFYLLWDGKMSISPPDE